MEHMTDLELILFPFLGLLGMWIALKLIRGLDDFAFNGWFVKSEFSKNEVRSAYGQMLVLQCTLAFFGYTIGHAIVLIVNRFFS